MKVALAVYCPIAVRAVDYVSSLSCVATDIRFADIIG